MNDFTRLFDTLYYQNTKYPMDKYLSYKYDGVWKSFSTKEVIDIANQMSSAFIKFGSYVTPKEFIY